MPEFEVHSPADEAQLNHGPAPGGAGNSHRHRLRAKLRVTGDERAAAASVDDGVPAVLRLDLEDLSLGQVVEQDPALNLRLRDGPVDLITQVRVRHEDVRAGLVQARV